MDNYSKLSFVLKHGNFPDCMLIKGEYPEELLFSIYNLFFDVHYHDILMDSAYIQLSTEELPEMANSYAINLITVLEQYEESRKACIAGILVYAQKIFSIKELEEHFYIWMEIAEEMYE
jgi:hypothetical protein